MIVSLEHYIVFCDEILRPLQMSAFATNFVCDKTFITNSYSLMTKLKHFVAKDHWQTNYDRNRLILNSMATV